MLKGFSWRGRGGVGAPAEAGGPSPTAERHEDAAEKRALEDALRHAQKMESLGTLTGGVAHDLNNILTAIIGYADLIKMKGGADDFFMRCATQIGAAADKAAVLTRGLLAYSRNQPMDPVHLDLNEVVGRVDRLLSRVLGESIELRTRLHPEPLRLLADGALLEQVLMTLAARARQAMPGGGRLEVATGVSEIDVEFFKRNGYGKPGRYAMLQVSDSGAGLDRAARERIFDPLPAAGAGEGARQGLPVVYGIVKQHQGYVELESEPGEGTALRIYFPLAAGLSPREPAPLARRGGETVLVVEDNPQVRGVVAEILQGAGYRVLEAADCAEGVRRFREEKEPVRLLLADLVLPGPGGEALYREIAGLDPAVRVLFVSGYPEEELRARGVLPQEGPVLRKPLVPAELLRKIETVLGSTF